MLRTRSWVAILFAISFAFFCQAQVPSGGVGAWQTFYFESSEPFFGARTTSEEYVMFNTAPAGANGCLVQFFPTLRLLSDDGLAWLGPAAFGADTTLSNSQCAVHAARSDIHWWRPTLSVNNRDTSVAISFKGAFAGNKSIYRATRYSDGSGGNWTQTGAWTVPSGGGPNVLSVAPLDGQGASQTFTARFAHSGGANRSYLHYVLFLPTPNTVFFTANGSCLIEYNRISNGVRLINDAGNNWLGGESGIPAGQPGALLTNSRCTVSVGGASASINGDEVAVTVPVQFTGLAGKVGVFLQAFDITGAYTDMRQFGTWTLPGGSNDGPRVTAGSVTPGANPNISTEISHPGGWAAISMVHIRVAKQVVDSPSCQIVYFVGSNSFGVINPSGTSFMFYPFGARCSPNFQPSMVSKTPGKLSIAGQAVILPGEHVYVNAFDTSGRLTHWVTIN